MHTQCPCDPAPVESSQQTQAAPQLLSAMCGPSHAILLTQAHDHVLHLPAHVCTHFGVDGLAISLTWRNPLSNPPGASPRQSRRLSVEAPTAVSFFFSYKGLKSVISHCTSNHTENNTLTSSPGSLSSLNTPCVVGTSSVRGTSRRSRVTRRKPSLRCTPAENSIGAPTPPRPIPGGSWAQSPPKILPIRAEYGKSFWTTCLPPLRPKRPDGLFLLRPRRVLGRSFPSCAWPLSKPLRCGPPLSVWQSRLRAEGTRVSCPWQVALPATTSDRPRSPLLAIVERVELREVQIADEPGCHSSSGLSAHLCCGAPQREPSLLQHPRPRASCAMVAKLVKSAALMAACCQPNLGGRSVLAATRVPVETLTTLSTVGFPVLLPPTPTPHGLETRGWVAVDAFDDRLNNCRVSAPDHLDAVRPARRMCRRPGSHR